MDSNNTFSFIKVTDKNQLFDFLLLNRLVSHPEELEGIGRLIFEMFKGVKHQFNACTEQVKFHNRFSSVSKDYVSNSF